MRKIINVEVKARCHDAGRVRAVLLSRHARFAGADHQRDTYFRVASGRLKLRQGNIENTLIYYHRPDVAGPKQSDVLLADVTAGDDLRAVLAAALGVRVTVDKRREIYFVGNIKFHIDEVAALGGFVEIEAAGAADADPQALLAQCREFIALFGINDADLVGQSYSDMLMEKVSNVSEVSDVSSR